MIIKFLNLVEIASNLAYCRKDMSDLIRDLKVFMVQQGTE